MIHQSLTRALKIAVLALDCKYIVPKIRPTINDIVKILKEFHVQRKTPKEQHNLQSSGDNNNKKSPTIGFPAHNRFRIVHFCL